MNEVKVFSKDLIPIVIDLLKKGKSVEFKISGNSMSPFFKHQKTIVTLNTKSTYKKYDVILYQANKQYILHRIIRVKNGVFEVYGDALKTKEIVFLQDVYGYVEYHKNKNKKIYYKHRCYTFKVFLWVLLKPFRKILLKIMRKVKQI